MANDTEHAGPPESKGRMKLHLRRETIRDLRAGTAQPGAWPACSEDETDTSDLCDPEETLA